MATRKSKKLDTFEGLYKRLEEVILANSGENEFESLLKTKQQMLSQTEQILQISQKLK